MSRGLLAAAEAGDVATIAGRLGAGEDIESRAAGTGRTPLLEAVIAGRVEAVEILCRRGADVEAACQAVGDNALCWAAGIGADWSGVDPAASLAITDVLLLHGADPNRVGEGSFLGHTALMRAVQAGNAEVVRRLADAGADVNAVNAQGNSALDIADRNTAQRDGARAAGARDDMVALLESLGATASAPRPEPESIPWPELPWAASDLAISPGAAPEQVLRGFILAMNRWEVSAHEAVTSDPGVFEASLATGTQVLRAYLTERPRARGGRPVSIGWPPAYNPDFVLVDIDSPTASRRVLTTRHPSPFASQAHLTDQYERRYALVRARGEWRVDALKERLRGTEKWENGIL